MPPPVEQTRAFLERHKPHRALTYHVAATGSGRFMVYLDCLGCGAGMGSSVSQDEADAISWPTWVRPR